MSEIILYRLSYYLPGNSAGRYWALNLNNNKIRPLEDKCVKKSVRLEDENGNWEAWEVDYQGYYCVEKTIFNNKIDFSVYTDNDKDFFLYNETTYNLSEIELAYTKGILFDCFVIKHNTELLIKYRYLRPVWRLLIIDDDDDDSVYPLKYIIEFIQKKSWKYERKHETEGLILG